MVLNSLPRIEQLYNQRLQKVYKTTKFRSGDRVHNHTNNQVGYVYISPLGMEIHGWNDDGSHWKTLRQKPNNYEDEWYPVDKAGKGIGQRRKVYGNVI